MRAGDRDGDGVVVAVVEASTRPVTGCAVSVTGSTTTAQRVVEAGGVLVETVVAGGGVTNFLLVVAGISVVVAAVSPDVITVVDVTGRRDASVVEVTRTLV